MKAYVDEAAFWRMEAAKQAARAECAETDGFSFCTLPPGHGPAHWDRRTQQEWGSECAECGATAGDGYRLRPDGKGGWQCDSCGDW